MGFLNRLLGREKKEDMPAEPQTRSEGTQPEPEGMAEPPPMPPQPGSEGSQGERNQP
jgi:hypothetical protein